MNNQACHFDDVTLLITHYNRSHSLENLLKSFRRLNCIFSEIVVSDDASKPEHLQKIKALQKEFSFRLVNASANSGLGNNINKGQDAAKTPLTLYIQEDFEPTVAFPGHFSDALDIMRDEKNVDIIRFYAFFNYPMLEPYKKGFAKMVFSPWTLDYKKFQYYSDHPHLRRSSFTRKFGRYEEGINPEQAEYRMGISFLQKEGKGLFYTNYHELFSHGNTLEEPSTMQVTRKNWKRSNVLFITMMREVYRHLKFRYDFMTMGKY